MDFLLENYIWFIIGFIVILMIVIGYLAEKTQFGSKKVSKKEKNIQKKKEEEVMEQVEQAKDTRINQAVLENANVLKKDPFIDRVTEPVPPKKEEIQSEIGEKVPQELTVPFGDTRARKEEVIPRTLESRVETPTMKKETPSLESFEDLYQPLEEVQEEPFEKEVSREQIKEEENIQIPLPDIQGLREEKNDDDVWNF